MQPLPPPPQRGPRRRSADRRRLRPTASRWLLRIAVLSVLVGLLAAGAVVGAAYVISGLGGSVAGSLSSTATSAESRTLDMGPIWTVAGYTFVGVSVVTFLRTLVDGRPRR